MPSPSASAFALDAVIKGEFVWAGPVARPAGMLVERTGPVVRSRDSNGAWELATERLSLFDSMLSQLADPQRMPELLRIREKIRPGASTIIRTDVNASSRLPQLGTHTPVLSNDGADLAAALQTILETGDSAALAETVSDAFPGAAIAISQSNGGFETTMRQHGLLRPLCDGTVRRDATLPTLGGCPLVSPTSSVGRPERARDKSSPGFASRPRKADRPGCAALPGLGCIPCESANCVT